MAIDGIADNADGIEVMRDPGQRMRRQTAEEIWIAPVIPSAFGDGSSAALSMRTSSGRKCSISDGLDIAAVDAVVAARDR